ncbi:MAG TPA: type II secretion system F family protein [Chthoniobacterales bacterium]|jgi:type II secretory pathway component PulF|nr:type II secretion system F family protein [Chthoniobacterales bacterium]
MPVFVFEAVNRGGKRVRGELTAQSRSEVFKKLDIDRLQPIKIEEKDGVNGSKPSVAERSAVTTKIRLSRTQIIRFTEELSDLLDAGLQIDPALQVMEKRKELSALKNVAGALRSRVREGTSLSTAMRAVCPSFGDLYCNLVSAGELSGSLPELLRRQAQFLVTINDLQQKVFAALTYPAMIFVVGIGLIFIFMTYLVPQITVLFEKTGKEIPLLTRLLIQTSGFMANYWWAILGTVVGVIVGFWQLIHTPGGRRWWHHTQLGLPVAGGVLRGRFYAQFAQTLANLVQNGLPLLSGLQLVKGGTGNEYWQTLIQKVTDYVGEGGSFSRGLEKLTDFPPMFIDMVGVGEQTGDLAKALDKVGQKYDKELNLKIQRLTALVQPVVIFLMAGMVGIIAYSIINGIFDAVSGLQNG